VPRYVNPDYPGYGGTPYTRHPLAFIRGPQAGDELGLGLLVTSGIISDVNLFGSERCTQTSDVVKAAWDASGFNVGSNIFYAESTFHSEKLTSNSHISDSKRTLGLDNSYHHSENEWNRIVAHNDVNVHIGKFDGHVVFQGNLNDEFTRVNGNTTESDRMISNADKYE
jgi:hypothetical protein